MASQAGKVGEPVAFSFSRDSDLSGILTKKRRGGTTARLPAPRKLARGKGSSSRGWGEREGSSKTGESRPVLSSLRGSRFSATLSRLSSLLLPFSQNLGRRLSILLARGVPKPFYTTLSLTKILLHAASSQQTMAFKLRSQFHEISSKVSRGSPRGSSPRRSQPLVFTAVLL